MIIEELEDSFGFSKFLWCPNVSLECSMDHKAGGLPMLVRQIVRSHDSLEQFTAGNGDVHGCEPHYKLERTEGRRRLYRFGEDR